MGDNNNRNDNDKSNDKNDKDNNKRGNKNCVCPYIYKPVCCNGGWDQYSNQCEADCNGAWQCRDGECRNYNNNNNGYKNNNNYKNDKNYKNNNYKNDKNDKNYNNYNNNNYKNDKNGYNNNNKDNNRCYNTKDKNPCNDRNTKGKNYYFASCTSECNFIQCDDNGNAFDMPCAPGTIWDQNALTCNYDKDNKCKSYRDNYKGEKDK